jgi:NhaP-type Na+/H+ or K+/H+ antiporter
MHNPALTIGLSMVLGMLAQVGSKHLHLPGIVLLLLSGILFGPDGLNWIDPASIGSGLHILVGFAVAIILFEGGMNLRISRIMRERRAIRGLIIKGALVTFVGGTFITIVVLGWDFRTSILFGTLIIVTGPTVITPLLKRIRVHHGVSTILEAEGILLDAIGAIIAVVALEIAISPSGLSFVTGLFHIISRLGVGAVLGISGGYLLTVMFRFRDLVPDGLENVFILSWVIALFQISNTISPESGIAAVTIAGMTIGNSKTYIQQDLLEFKEQLTVLMIGMLFILLSADVRIEQIIELGVPGLITVAMLIFLIRPLSVFIGTDKSGLALNQKLLLSWIAPRGIVAAAVASLFVYELEIHGYDGTPLRALVFLLIIVTVLLAGLTGGFVAGRLNLRRKSQSGWIILGAHEIARLLSGILKKAGNDIICIDEDPNACLKAENEGLKVFFGNALDDRTLQRAEPDTRKGIIALSGNEEVNYIFSQRAKHLSKEMSILIGIKDSHEGITPKMIVDAGGKIPFGHSADMDFWSSLVKQSLTYQKSYVYRSDKIFDLSDETIKGFLLPMVLKQKKSLEPIDNTMKIKSGNQITFLINKKNEKKATDWLKENGFESASNRT